MPLKKILLSPSEPWGPPLVGDVEENGLVIQVERFFGERVTGFVSDQHTVDPGLVSIATRVRGSHRAFQCVDSKKTPVKDGGQLRGVLVPGPKAPAMISLEVRALHSEEFVVGLC